MRETSDMEIRECETQVSTEIYILSRLSNLEHRTKQEADPHGREALCVRGLLHGLQATGHQGQTHEKSALSRPRTQTAFCPCGSACASVLML